MNTPPSRGLDWKEIHVDEEEEDDENWAMPASTLPGQAGHFTSPISVPSSHQIISGNYFTNLNYTHM